MWILRRKYVEYPFLRSLVRCDLWLLLLAAVSERRLFPLLPERLETLAARLQELESARAHLHVRELAALRPAPPNGKVGFASVEGNLAVSGIRFDSDTDRVKLFCIALADGPPAEAQ